MHHRVHLQASLGFVHFLADVALEGSLLTMETIMARQVRLFRETLAALVARVGPLAVVVFHVLLHIHLLRERFTANVAHEPTPETMDVHVGSEPTPRMQHLTAFDAGVVFLVVVSMFF